MNYTLIIDPSAQADLADIVIWYKKETLGVEKDFQHSFQETLERIIPYP